MRPCVVPDCPALVARGSRCPAHPSRWQGGSSRAQRVQHARVLERDGYRCTFVLADGTRCRAMGPLEVHHLRGGPAVVVPDEELATVCRAHNPRGG